MKNQGFTMIQNDFLRSPNLTAEEKIVLTVIMSHDQNIYNIRREILSAQTGIELKKLQRIIKGLVGKNILFDVEKNKIRSGKTFIRKYLINFELDNLNQSKLNQSKLSTLKKNNLKEEQTVPLKEEKNFIISDNIGGLELKSTSLTKETKEEITILDLLDELKPTNPVKKTDKPMIPDDIYEDFYKPLESLNPVKKIEPVKESTTSIERDNLGLTPEARKMLESKLLNTNLEDLCKIYPDMKESLKSLHLQIGKPNVKPVEELTFSEFWIQQELGEIPKKDVDMFQTSASLWKSMNSSEKHKALRDFKPKFKRGVTPFIILSEIIDNYYSQKLKELKIKEDHSDYYDRIPDCL